MPIPKFEFEITVPAGGWAAAVDGGAATVPAATYYLGSAGSGSDDFIKEVQDQFQTRNADITVTIAAATGLVTIADGAAATTTVVWTSTDLQDALGFTGNLSGAASYTGTYQASHMWLPNVGDSGRLASIASLGARSSDQVVTRSRSGRPVSTIFNRYTEEAWEFQALTAAKTWQADESTVNESAERCWVNYFSAGTPFRYYTDRTDDTSYLVSSTARTYVFKADDDGGFRPKRQKGAVNALWRWSFGGYLDV